MKQVFGAGTARGGTGLVVQTMRAHNEIEVAMEPFLTLFKSYRSAVLNDLSSSFDIKPSMTDDPISALYFESEAVPYLDKITSNPSDYPVCNKELEIILNGIKARAQHDANDLIPHLNSIHGSNYSEIIDSLIQMIVIARKRRGLNWCGFMENWCVEFFPFLADFFPDSRFFIVMRDPRAVICSSLYAPKELQATFLSYLRALRKLFDLSLHYLMDPRFEGRLCIVKYEALVSSPSGISAQISDFFGLDYDSQMIDPKYHVIPGTKKQRDGVSTFEKQTVGYSKHRINRWREILSSTIQSLINSCMAEEMEIFGYLEPTEKCDLSLDLVLKALKEPRMYGGPNWSTDLATLSANYGAEMIRTALINSEQKTESIDEKLILECFISKSVFDLLKGHQIRKSIPTSCRSFENLILA